MFFRLPQCIDPFFWSTEQLQFSSTSGCSLQVLTCVAVPIREFGVFNHRKILNLDSSQHSKSVSQDSCFHDLLRRWLVLLFYVRFFGWIKIILSSRDETISLSNRSAEESECPAPWYFCQVIKGHKAVLSALGSITDICPFCHTKYSNCVLRSVTCLARCITLIGKSSVKSQVSPHWSSRINPLSASLRSFILLAWCLILDKHSSVCFLYRILPFLIFNGAVELHSVCRPDSSWLLSMKHMYTLRI